MNADADVARMVAAGYSWHQIAQSLNARGVPTMSGRGEWWASTVRRHFDDRYRADWAGYVRRYRAVHGR